jgi:hypothetical protein
MTTPAPTPALRHAVLATFLTVCATSAVAQSCGHAPAPEIRITSAPLHTTLDTSKSYRALSRQEGHRAREHAVLGLTRVQAESAIRLSFRTVLDATHQGLCISPLVDVRLTLAPIQVFIGREFPKGTCTYAVIYEHEMRHAKTYAQHAMLVENRLREAMRNRYGTEAFRVGVRQGPDLVRQLQNEVRTTWLPFLQQEIDRVEPAQAAIDSPEEYARLAQACRGETQRLMAAAP